LPSGPLMRHTSERPLDQLTLDLYPGDGEFTLYEDDGETLAYEQGAWCTTTYRLSQHKKALILHMGARQGQHVPHARTVRLRLHAARKRAARAHPEGEYD